MFAELSNGLRRPAHKKVQTLALRRQHDENLLKIGASEVDLIFATPCEIRESNFLNPAAARHDRSAQQNDDNRGQLGMNNHRHTLAARSLPDRHLPGPDGAAPG